MTGGYMGKILRVNLSTGLISTIDTSKYEEWGGGNGMGTAIFWDLCEDKSIQDGLDSRNVVTLMTSPLSGTGAPSVAGRTEVNGIGAQPYPIGWHTRSNFGGRFAHELKYAGWDGIVLEGKADAPVWLNIENDRVTLEDASDLLGLDTWDTQAEIWRRVTDDARFGEWHTVGDAYTTQRPAVVCIGPAGENLSRIASLMHDAGNSAGQGGFGGIFGSKNLKAISVRGTGSVSVADPQALMDGWKWMYEKHGRTYSGWPATRRQGCLACVSPCRTRTRTGVYNESQCVEAVWYYHSKGHLLGFRTSADDQTVMKQACDLAQRYGINAFEISGMVPYLYILYDKGILGPGKAIDSDPLPWDDYMKLGWAEAFLRAISFREGIGDDLAEGTVWAANKWGRMEEDLESGDLLFPQWGYCWHWTLPGIEWAWGSLLGDRDINEHCIPGSKGGVEPADFAAACARGIVPWDPDPYMMDFGYGPTGIYSTHKAKLIFWHRHYTRFWKQSIAYCDWGPWPDMVGSDAPDYKGTTPEAEPLFFNAVTGKNITYRDGMELGRKIWNLQKSIWVLQGRHRDLEKFAGFMYKSMAHLPHFQGYQHYGRISGTNAVYYDGEWSYENITDMFLDRDGVEEFKSNFYELEGWNTSNGWPTRATLEGLDLGFVADELESKGKLG